MRDFSTIIVKKKLIRNISGTLPDILKGIWTFHINISIVRFFNKPELEYNTQQLYEDYYYKKAPMDCNFKYKKGDKTGRSFFVPKRKENQPATQLSP